MLDLFSTKKPAATHPVSHTTLNGIEDHADGEVHWGHAFQECNGPLKLPSLPQQSVLIEPRKTHQRSLTEYNESSWGRQHLQPLCTDQFNPPNPIRSQTPALPIFGSPPIHPDVQRQQSPARSTKRSNSPRLDTKVTKIASWFQGESEPIKVGVVPSPSKERFEEFDLMSSSSTSRPALAAQANAGGAPSSTKPAMASRFSFFSSKNTLSKQASPISDGKDEILSMDTKAALFPTGPPDPFSPAGFKNLQQQAEGLLSRLQSAYKERTQALQELAAEKEVLAEETQGAETRAQHLKIQLDKMAVKLAEQDEIMMNLVEELAQEKSARREEEEFRKRSVRLIDREATRPTSKNQGRVSWSNTVSECGFESEDDSSADSVFSRRNGMHSPAMSMSSVSTTNSPDATHPPNFSSLAHRTAQSRVPPSATPARGSARPTIGSSEPVQPVICSNCHGVGSSEAWSFVSILKEENQCLKYRVEELEGALDGALDVVGQLGG